MTGKELREALHNGKRVYGTLIVSPSPKWLQAGISGVDIDFVFIDTEHIPLDIETVGWMCHAYRGKGLPAVVRIPEPDPYQASRMLDAGANGIIIPYVESVEQLRPIVGAVKYKPLKGKKLDRILSGEEVCEPGLAKYLEKYNENNLLIANIESVPAMENLDEILNLPGLDAVLIGPHDLTCNLEIPAQYEHPKFDAAVREIITKARAKGIGAGIHFWPSTAQTAKWANEVGLNLIIHHADMSIFCVAMQREINEIRKAVGDPIKGKKMKDEAV